MWIKMFPNLKKNYIADTMDKMKWFQRQKKQNVFIGEAILIIVLTVSFGLLALATKNCR